MTSYTGKVSLEWITPNAENLISHMARVSNPSNQDNYDTAPRLLKYLLKNKHFSPFEMANACVKIETTRDISHQLIRHRSFTFQEFSGRYAEYPTLLEYREPRMQDHKNRQNSLENVPREVGEHWNILVGLTANRASQMYHSSILDGLAKEVVRTLLPEGLVPTTVYMNGTIRSWIHYLEVRTDPSTQKEHRLVAESCKSVIFNELPTIKEALNLG